jgi:hypothetical protein
MAWTPELRAHLSFNLVVDQQGNAYFLEIFQNSLMKITPEGQVSELVDVRMLAPEERLHALAIDAAGNLYVAGYYMEKIWKVSAKGEVSSHYPGVGMDSFGLEVLHAGLDRSGSLYVMLYTYVPVDGERRFRVLKLPGPDQEPTELLSCGEGEDGSWDFHKGSMLVTEAGTVYLSGGHRIWKIADGQLQLVAGGKEEGFVDGLGSAARFTQPYGMTQDRNGDVLVAELAGRVRRVSTGGEVTTVTGTEERGSKDGPRAKAQFDKVFAVAAGPKGRLYIAEYSHQKEYRIRILSEDQVTTLARIPTESVFRK